MKLVNYTPTTTQENIALDELLLAGAEAGRIGETLRFWEARGYFVVLGRASRAAEDCFTERCRRDNVGIIRRISGGGTVLQGPGCLNYSLVLSYERDLRYKDIRLSYLLILNRITGILKREGYDLEVFPVSDIALDGKKVSGNAQARKKRCFLHHGTFLYDFDLGKVACYLRHPSHEPEYREGRGHEHFLDNLPTGAGSIRGMIREAFCLQEPALELGPGDIEELKEITARKYLNDGWNLRF